MLRTALPAAAALFSFCALPVAAAEAVPTGSTSVVVQAAAPPMRTISLSTSAHVEYEPDRADLTFGARADAPSAAEASSRANAVAARIVAAETALGIERKRIRTSAYEVAFTEAVAPTFAIKNGKRVVVQPGVPASYTVTTTFAVTAPIDVAGKAIDGAVRAGANDSYGLSFSSSHLDDYYAQALASAMRSARTRADALAGSAGVAIDALQTVTTSGAPASSEDAAPAPAMRESFAVSKAAPAVVVAGTLSVDASVDAVFTIK